MSLPVILWATATFSTQALAATTVASGTTELAGSGESSGNYVEWVIDGILAINGDQTGVFARDQGILTSIKIWDDAQQEYMRVAEFNKEHTVSTTSYFNLLEILYISDADAAALQGVSNDFVGYTIVRNTAVPLPSSMTVLGLGIFSILGILRKRDE